MKVFISAAEASSDAHGAELLKALRERVGTSGTIEAFGIGGPKLKAAGLEILVDSRQLLSMGFIEVLGKLPRILGILRRVSMELERRSPDLAVVIDYPDFHMRLAKALFRLKVPTFYYIPPKLWVWRKRRIEALKKYFRGVFCIFPFEEGFYRREGMAVKYVGNPLLDELPLSLTKREARERLGIGAADRVLVLMPGSRPAELEQHLAVMLEAARLTARELREKGYLEEGRRLRVLIPVSAAATPEMNRDFESARSNDLLDISLAKGETAPCLAAADAALVKSGTSTLEAALFGCPHAVVYKTSASTALLYRLLVRYSGPVGLVNLILPHAPGSSPVAREILLGDVTAQNLAQEAVRLLTDDVTRERMKRDFAAIRQALAPAADRGPSARLAEELLNEVGHG